MPKAALTSEGDGKAVAPEAADLVPRKADLLVEYIAGAAQSFENYARSLPPWQDLLTRDFPDVYERMLLDPVVHASARVIKLSVLADDITPRPAVDDQDDPDFDLAKELADFCADVQGGMKRALEDVWYEHLDGLFTGSRVSEKVARVQDGGPHAGKLVWDRINPKPTYNVGYVLDPFGNLVGLLTRPPGEGWGGVGGGTVEPDDPNLLPREKFVVFTWDPRDGDPRGRALLRHCYQPWWHKQQALNQWLKFLAQTAVPSLFATTPQGAGVLPPQDALGNPTGAQATSPQQQLLNELVKFQGGSAMVAAAGTVLTVIQSAGDGEVFSRRIDYADSCIAREITLQTLATIEAKHGTRAQAEVHQDSLDLGVDYIRRVSCRVIREDVYRPLIRYNWGDDAADRLCPFASMTAVAKQDLNTTLPAYASVGYQLAPDQLPAVDEELGLPVRKEQPPEQQPPLGDGNQPGNPPDGNQPPGGADPGLSKSTVAGFAADEDGHWVTLDDGQHVLIRGGQVHATREGIAGAGSAGPAGVVFLEKVPPEVARDPALRDKGIKVKPLPEGARRVVSAASARLRQSLRPEIARLLDRVEVAAGSQKDPGQRTALRDSKRQIVLFNPSALGRKLPHGAKPVSAEESGFADSSPEGVVRHELAHAIEGEMEPAEAQALGLYGLNWFASPYARTNMREKWAEFFTHITRPDFDPSSLPPAARAVAEKILRPAGERGPDAGLSKSTVPPAAFAAPDFPLPWDELSGLSREEMLSLLADAALQSRLSIPADEAAEAPFYSQDQLRDEQGRWTSGGGGLSPAEHERNRSAAADAVRAFARGTTRPTEDEVRAVAGHLSRLTVAQLHAIKAEHGLKASATDKAALVQKLALRFTSHRQNNQQEGLTEHQKESKIPVGSEEPKPTGERPMATTAVFDKLAAVAAKDAYGSTLTTPLRFGFAQAAFGPNAGKWFDPGVPPVVPHSTSPDRRKAVGDVKAERQGDHYVVTISVPHAMSGAKGEAIRRAVLDALPELHRVALERLRAAYPDAEVIEG